jgi:hypothetical protein
MRRLRGRYWQTVGWCDRHIPDTALGEAFSWACWIALIWWVGSSVMGGG